MSRYEFDLDKAISAWRRSLEFHRAISAEDLDELEQHLRDQVQESIEGGISPAPAFDRAIREMGGQASADIEYRKVYWGKLRRRRQLSHELAGRLAMWKGYLTIALRQLKRQPLYAGINVMGLAVGMACCMVVLFYVQDELRYDRYHDRGDRIYRVSNRAVLTATGEASVVADSPLLWAPALKNEYPEVENYARFSAATSPSNPWDVSYGEGTFRESRLLYADPSVFDVFSWRLKKGNPETALVPPNSIVLSETTARKYFGDQDPLGKMLTIDPKWRDQAGQLIPNAMAFTVTGIMEDIPRRSHITADFLLSINLLNSIYGGDVTTGTNLNPGFWRYRFAYSYLLLREGADPAALEAKLEDFLDRNVHASTRERGYYYEAFLQPLPDIYLGGQLEGQPAPVGDRDQLTIFSIVAFFVLLVGCINFMNLSTARALQRAREVGVRKVVGAHYHQLVKQFLGESTLISFLAIFLAVGLAWLLLPVFYGYLQKNFVFSRDDITITAAGIVAVGLFVGLLAGSYPAFFLARFRPIAVLRGRLVDRGRGQWLRKGLVVFQFAFSAFLVIGTLTVMEQLTFLRNHRLGFDQDRVLVLKSNIGQALMANYEAFRNELRKDPGIVDVTASSGLPGLGVSGDLYGVEGAPGVDAMPIAEYAVDVNFLDVMGIELIAGRNFSPEVTTDAGVFSEDGRLLELALIVNEEAVRQFGWASPEEALGKRIIRDPGAVDFTGTIIGVVKDFHFDTLRQPIGPLAISAFRGRSYIAIKVGGENLQRTIDHVRAATERFAPSEPFEVSFLDDNFAALYESEQRAADVFGYVSALAIIIACLGLFGLATYAAERRTKEIGIRKVMGASVANIIGLLSGEFLKLVVLALVLAAPTAWYIMERWLDGFAYRTDLSIRVFLIAGIAALAIALLSVNYQSAKAALANPVRSLRYE